MTKRKERAELLRLMRLAKPLLSILSVDHNNIRPATGNEG
jgi:hypothetical protein